MEQIEKAYDSVIRAVKRANGLVDIKVEELEYKKRIALLKHKLNVLGFSVSYLNSDTYVDLSHNTFRYNFFKAGDGKKISWSDDNRQPLNEELIVVTYPTGAYYLNKEYDTKTFNEFFNELKSFGYEYLDSANKSIYFSLEVGAEVYKNYEEILAKYKKLSLERTKEKRVEELKKQIEDINNGA